MTNFVWLNGHYVSAAEAKISALDRGFLYGEGLFETIRVYNGAPFQMSRHYERLKHSAKRLKIPCHIGLKSLEQTVNKLVKLNDRKESYVRITVSAGPKPHPCSDTPVHGESGTILIESRELPAPYAKYRQTGARAVIYPYKRSPESPLYQHKTLSFMEYIIARKFASDNDAVDSIFVNTRNEVTEGSTSNVFMVKSGKVITPPLGANILAGVTRQTIFGLCTKNALWLRESDIKVKDLLSADEVFITNSLMEVMPIIEIMTGKERIVKIGDGQPGLISQMLIGAYQDLI
ncbi:MAG: aminotransferase class IV [Planctomycetes bacterium]|nr:aminotransferase class IV [Planctomycetota bacterium]